MNLFDKFLKLITLFINFQFIWISYYRQTTKFKTNSFVQYKTVIIHFLCSLCLISCCYIIQCIIHQRFSVTKQLYPLLQNINFFVLKWINYYEFDLLILFISQKSKFKPDFNSPYLKLQQFLVRNLRNYWKYHKVRLFEQRYGHNIASNLRKEQNQFYQNYN
ncbi:hypothetical protein pb186bvf_012275 [Paramecium bursaria]